MKGFDNEESAKEAVREVNDTEMDGYKLKVEIAGKPRKPKGPQPND
jgi:RNA recognition motif-containing protein